eukprot:g22772.t1
MARVGIGAPNAGAALNSCTRGAAWPQALEILRQMPQWQVDISLISYNIVMDACVRGKEWQRSLHLFSRMPESSLTPDSISYTFATCAWAVSAKWPEALDLAMQMQGAGFPLEKALPSLLMAKPGELGPMMLRSLKMDKDGKGVHILVVPPTRLMLLSRLGIPFLVVWNLGLAVFVLSPLCVALFLTHPIRLSRAAVFVQSIVCAVYSLAFLVQLMVWTGQCYAGTLSELKSWVSQQLEVPVCEQRFFLDGEVISDSVLATLSRDQTTLELQLLCLDPSWASALEAVCEDGHALEHFPKVQNDREIVMAAVKSRGTALKFADPALRRDREIALAAVAKDGHALRYASALRADREVVLAAALNSGSSIQHAAPHLRKDIEIGAMCSLSPTNGPDLNFVLANFVRYLPCCLGGAAGCLAGPILATGLSLPSWARMRSWDFLKSPKVPNGNDEECQACVATSECLRNSTVGLYRHLRRPRAVEPLEKQLTNLAAEKLRRDLQGAKPRASDRTLELSPVYGMVRSRDERWKVRSPDPYFPFFISF